MAPRKIDTPEVSFPYHLFYVGHDTEVDSINTDERKRKQLYIKLGVISQSKGSAYIEIGNTKIIASVQDPREQMKQARRTAANALNCDFKYAPFALASQTSISSVADSEKLYSSALKKALRPAIYWQELSNFQLDVSVFVLEDDGCVLSTAINCASLALMNGGVPLYDVLTASSVAVKRGEIIPDPTKFEEDFCSRGTELEHGIVTVARLESSLQTTEFHVVGYISNPTLKKCKAELVEHSITLAKVLRKLLVRQTEKDLENIEKKHL